MQCSLTAHLVSRQHQWTRLTPDARDDWHSGWFLVAYHFYRPNRHSRGESLSYVAYALQMRTVWTTDYMHGGLHFYIGGLSRTVPCTAVRVQSSSCPDTHLLRSLTHSRRAALQGSAVGRRRRPTDRAVVMICFQPPTDRPTTARLVTAHTGPSRPSRLLIALPVTTYLASTDGAGKDMRGVHIICHMAWLTHRPNACSTRAYYNSISPPGPQ